MFPFFTNPLTWDPFGIPNSYISSLETGIIFIPYNFCILSNCLDKIVTPSYLNSSMFKGSLIDVYIDGLCFISIEVKL